MVYQCNIQLVVFTTLLLLYCLPCCSAVPGGGGGHGGKGQEETSHTFLLLKVEQKDRTTVLFICTVAVVKPSGFRIVQNGTTSSELLLLSIELEVLIWGLAVITCGIVMALILCLKAYKTFVDRLVLYNTLATCFFSVAMILQTVGLMESKVKESVFNGVCSTVGYLTTLTIWMLVLFLMTISLYLFLLMAFHIKVSKYEKLIVVSIPIISAVIATIPLMTKSYGFSSGFCWVISRDMNSHNQSSTGFAEQMVLGETAPMMAAAFNFLIAVYVAWTICRQRGERRQHMEAVKETIHLVLYPIINELVNFVLLASHIDYYINDLCCQRILSWLTAASTPLVGIGTTLALLFHVILTEHRRRNRKRKRTESETRYTVPPEFPSEADPLVITGACPQEPVTAFKTLFVTESIQTHD